MSKELLGKNVVVTLDSIPGQGDVIAKGQLLAFDEWGECVIRDEMGGLRWCWPMLHVSEDFEAKT